MMKLSHGKNILKNWIVAISKYKAIDYKCRLSSKITPKSNLIRLY